VSNAESLGIHPIMLYRWRKEYKDGKFKEDKRNRKVQIDPKKFSEIVHIQKLGRQIENSL